MKKFGIIFMVMVTLTSITSIDMDATETQESTFMSIKEDIETINEIQEEDIESFITENEIWISDLNLRLEDFLKVFSEEEKINVVNEL